MTYEELRELVDALESELANAMAGLDKAGDQIVWDGDDPIVVDPDPGNGG